MAAHDMAKLENGPIEQFKNVGQDEEAQYAQDITPASITRWKREQNQGDGQERIKLRHDVESQVTTSQLFADVPVDYRTYSEHQERKQ